MVRQEGSGRGRGHGRGRGQAKGRGSKEKTEEEQKLDKDLKRGCKKSNTKASLYAAVHDGLIPINEATDEDETKLKEYFNLRPEICNYGHFDLFKGRLTELETILFFLCFFLESCVGSVPGSVPMPVMHGIFERSNASHAWDFLRLMTSVVFRTDFIRIPNPIIYSKFKYQPITILAEKFRAPPRMRLFSTNKGASIAKFAILLTLWH